MLLRGPLRDEAQHLGVVHAASRVHRCHALGRSEISDHCLNSRIAWNAGFYYQKIALDDCFSLLSNGGIFTTPHLTWPLGVVTAQKLECILDAVYPVFAARGWPLRLMYIDAAGLPLLKELRQYTASISYNPDFSDYIYDADLLRDLSGKAMHKKRNHVNRFYRLYPDFTYEPIRQDHQAEAMALVQAWCDEKQVDCLNLCGSDYRAVRQLFREMHRLDVRGGCIRIDGKLAAFALGSELNGDTAVIHFEKADAAYDGLYAAINQMVLQNAFPDVRWVNREEDMGILGLRKAKESYGPVRQVHKYEALLTRI